MKQAVVSVLLAGLYVSFPLHAQEKGVAGYWKEPSGSVIRIEPCGADLCAAVVQISPSAPGRTDVHNPDASLRQRSLCGLRIGQGFHLKGAEKAEGGTLYDPKSGKTYRGSMESHGDRLALRGYIGFSFLGRTETWTRTSAVAQCER